MRSEDHLSQRARLAGGQPISALMHLALARPELISLAAGFVDGQTLPLEATAEALKSLTADTADFRAALQYGSTPGHGPLREAILQRQIAADGGFPSARHMSVENVVLTAGSNQLLHLVAEALLDPGDMVLCASPTYFVFLGVLSNLGVRSVGIRTDEQGIVPEALEEYLHRRELAGDLRQVKAIYVTSYFDNPSSITLAAERRSAIVEIAKRWSRQHRIYVIEDAAYRELRYTGDDLPSLRAYDESGDTVILAGTFSKSFSPGVRVGWGILPPSLVGPVCDLKGNLDFGSPHFAQHLMMRVFRQGLYDPHVELLRQGYRAKMNAMLDAADEHLSSLPGVSWQRPDGGLYVWLTLPAGLDAGPEGPLLERAVEAGVLYVPGHYCYPHDGEPIQTNRIRLSFGVQTAENIRRGVAALGEAIRQACGTQAVDRPAKQNGARVTSHAVSKHTA